MVFKSTYSDYVDTIFLHYFLTSHIPQEVVYIIIRTVICVSAVNLGNCFGLKLLYLQYIHCTVAAGEVRKFDYRSGFPMRWTSSQNWRT